MRRLLFGLLLIPLSAAASDVHECMLDNGLKLLIKEDHRAPIVVSQVWYKVGSSYESSGLTGSSHVLEHMMFKGTEKYGPNEFSQIISRNGGRENAFTGRDYTAYFQTLSADRLNVAFELEADRMQNLSMAEEEFQKEVKVVMEERRLRTEDKPTSYTYEQFNAVAYRTLPYRHPIIGWMNDLENMQLEDLSAWYKRWYVPNNATLVVVGDVDPQEVLKMAQETFGKIPPGEVKPLKNMVEPEQKGITRLQVKLPAQQPYLVMGYKTPSIATAGEDWEPYALEVLAAVLDGGNSARLQRQLVRSSQIAISAGASYDSHVRLSGMLLMDAVPGEGKTVKDLEKGLLSEIEKLKTELVDENELKRVITQTVAAKVYEKDSVFYQAMKLGILETVGLGWQMDDLYVEKLKAVTPEQVQLVAQRYLIPENLTVAALDPLPMDTMQQPSTGVINGGGRAH